MPVFNYGEIFFSLLTWLKLGVSTALLVLIVTKLIAVWEDTQTASELRPQTENVIRY